MPSYKYRPSIAGTEPAIRTRSTRRARLFAGGTYFRARDPGVQGNNISVELIDWVSTQPGEEGVRKGKLIVTNHNTVFSENVTGPADVELLEQELTWRERYVIDQLTGTPQAHKYSISLQIAPAAVLEEDIGPFNFSRLFHIPSKLSVKLTPRTSEFTQTSVITIKARTRVYDLVEISVTPEAEEGEPAGEPMTGWDPEALRTAVNASDPWIEMMERSGTEGSGGGVPLPDLEKPDAQDDGVDDTFLFAFPSTRLAGGDGLPLTPSGERTGPSRSIVHINFGEAYNGKMAEVNEVYEWVGETPANGVWKRY
jgi:hypothetical protein